MTYKYQALEHTDSFRLLRLSPSEDSAAELHCELVTSRLALAPDFEAISYTWDHDIFPVTLHASSGLLKITENLASALRQFRLWSSHRMLWVDAVCINQDLMSERNQQVSIMSRIYQDARRVLCWIGESDEKTDGALSYIRQLAASCSRYNLGEVDANMWFQIPILDASKEEEARCIVQDARKNHMVSISGRRWFTRLWVVQEVTLSKEAILCCGKYEMAWKLFATAMLVLSAAIERAGPWAGASEVPRSEVEAFLQSWDIVRTRAKHRLLSQENCIITSSHTAFAMVVSRLLLHECSLDHDRIYALLGLNGSKIPIKVIPDYSKPVEKLYADFAIAHFRRREIVILYDAGLVRRNPDKLLTNDRKLPSWAPEYRKANLSDWLSPYAWEQESYSAALELPATIEFEADGNAILVKGVLLDQLKFAFNIPIPPGQPSHNFGTIRDLVSTGVKEFRDINPEGYPTNEDPSMVLARLFLLDGTVDHTRRYLPHQTREIMLEHWLAYEKHCLSESGEVYLKVEEADLRIEKGEVTDNGFWEDEFPASLSEEARKGWIFHCCLKRILGKCPIASMHGGVLGMVPARVIAGDDIAIFEGARMPMKFASRTNAFADMLEFYGASLGYAIEDEYQA